MRRGRAEFEIVEGYQDAEPGKVVMLFPWGSGPENLSEPDPDVDRLEAVRKLNAEEARACRRRYTPPAKKLRRL